MSLSFERSEWFAFDKAANSACWQLEPANTCAIHARLTAEGQAGCSSYDCYGAGQRACALFDGVTWRDVPDQARALFSTFRRLRDVHELRFLLHEAGCLALASEHAKERSELLAELEPEPDFNLASLEALELHALELRTRRLLRSLRGYFDHQPARRHLRVRR